MEIFIFFIINSFAVYLLASKSNIIGKKLNLLDHPSKFKIHTLPVPFIGGIIIYVLLLAHFIFCLFFKANLNLFMHLYISAFFLIGLIDDKFNLNSYYKILLVILISLILITFDKSFLIHKIFFEISNNEFYFGKLKVPVTIFCILLLYIAINMSDGINCLLISFTAIALIVINIIILKGNLDFVDFSLFSSLLILLYFNYNNKIFLGNTGANLLAAYFIYLLINGNYHNSIDVFQVISLFLIMGIDMVRLILIRIYNKQNPFHRDLNHFHHILMKKFGIRLTLVIYLMLSFMPIILSFISNVNTIMYIPFQILIYFTVVYKIT